MNAAITVDDEVVVRDPKQLGPLWPPSAVPTAEAVAGLWFIRSVSGVAAFIVRGPLSVIGYTTPLSNLRRAGAR